MMRTIKLLAVVLLITDVAIAQEAAGAGSLATRSVIDGRAQRPSGMEWRPSSVLDSPGEGTDYRFVISGEARPAGWSLLLGALLSGGFIIRRRLGAS